MEDQRMTQWHMWIIFFLSSGASAFPLNSECRRPEIKSPRAQLQVYERVETVSVTVYHCLYKEEDVCSTDICTNCQPGGPDNPVHKRTSRKYSDVSRNCLKAFKSPFFTDQYGFIHAINEPRTTHYTCDAAAKLIKTTRVTLTKYEAEADVAQDKIVLRSGAVCKYTTGFCHDENENINVLWEVNLENTNIQCNNLRKVEVTDSYYFVLNQNTFAVIQSNDNYFTLRLENYQSNVCNVEMWETSGGKFVVAEGDVSQTERASVQATNELGNYFQTKQDLHDFLIEKCVSDIENAIYKTIPLDGVIYSKAIPLDAVIHSKAVPLDAVIDSKAIPLDKVIDSKAIPLDGVIDSKAIPLDGVIDSKAVPLDGVIDSKAISLDGVINSNYNALLESPRQETASDASGFLYSLLKNVSVICVIALVIYIRHRTCRKDDTYQEI